MIVADGEGAARVGRVHVTGESAQQVDEVARPIANSPLVKTALNGGDPNWGRIVQAAGAALAGGGAVPIDVWIEGLHVCSAGAALAVEESTLAAAVARDEVEYRSRCPARVPRPRSSSRISPTTT